MISNALVLRLADKIGTIEKRKFVDMVVLRENLKEKIDICGIPQLVVQAGRVYDVTKNEEGKKYAPFS